MGKTKEEIEIAEKHKILAQIVRPGIYPDVPYSEYEKWDAVNNSVLWILESKSPLHAKEFKNNPPPSTPAFIKGGAFHILALEPRKFNLRYSVTPKCDRRTAKGKKIYKAYEDNLNGKQILSQEQYEEIYTMVEAIKKQIVYCYIQKGEAEVCIVWEDKKTGLLCKARLDYVHRNRGYIIDLKSTTDASAHSFARSIYNYGYFQQAAFYSDGWKTLTGDETAFVFLPVEKSPPYAVAAYEAHEQLIIAGQKSYQQALKTYAECLKTDKWPSYMETVEMINLPMWALNQIGYSEYEEYE